MARAASARDKPLVIFGAGAQAGEAVFVSLATKRGAGVADADRRWQVALLALKAGGLSEMKVPAAWGEQAKMVRAIPNTALGVAVDTDDAKSIHRRAGKRATIVESQERAAAIEGD